VYVPSVVSLEPGDRVCFFTDGLVEARNEIGEMFGTDRLTGCLANHGRLSAADILSRLLDYLRDFRGTSPLSDDLTVAVLEVVGSE
jgi:phosphoserine phosphatase RsbU/P